MSASERPSPEVRLLVTSWPEDAPRGAVVAFCREHRVSTSWFHKVRKSAVTGGVMAALEPASTRPKTSPNRTADEVVMLVVTIREQLVAEGLDYGPLSVLARLRRMGFTDPPSRATLSRIFTQVGVVVAEPKKKPRSAFRRFVYPAPNCLWQIDATEWSLSTGATCVVFQLIDDHSRLALASLVAAAETSEAAVRVVRIAVARHGAPQKFLSDNGVAFNPTRRGYSGKLVDYLHSLGVETITGKPYKPTTQGKNERFHRTLHRYLNAHPPADSMDELQDLVDAFDVIYNTEREHQSLTGTAPHSRPGPGPQHSSHPHRYRPRSRSSLPRTKPKESPRARRRYGSGVADESRSSTSTSGSAKATKDNRFTPSGTPAQSISMTSTAPTSSAIPCHQQEPNQLATANPAASWPHSPRSPET